MVLVVPLALPLLLLLALIVLRDGNDAETYLPPPSSSSRPIGPVDLRMLRCVAVKEYECCDLRSLPHSVGRSLTHSLLAHAAMKKKKRGRGNEVTYKSFGVASKK
jgi:hypothetical protein